MESEQHDTVFPEDDMDDDDDESQFDLEEEEEDDDDVLVDDEENEPSPSTSSALAVTIAVPGSAISNGDKPPISTATATATRLITAAADSSDSKRQRVELQIEEKKPLVDDSRRLFQRLWTDEDEIELLQGFLDYTSHRGSSHHNDTALFYDQIKSKLQLDFNKNQLVEKIRRLKKKYRNVLNKINSGKDFSFKTAHDQATFEISRKIWSNIGQTSFTVEDNALDEDEIPNPIPNINLNIAHSTPPKYEVVMLGNSAEKKSTPSRKRSKPRSAPFRPPMIRPDEKRESNDGSALNNDHNCINNATATVTPTIANNNNDNNCNSVHSVPGLIEETVRSCLSPLLKELVGGAMGGRGFGGFSMNPMSMQVPMPLSNLSFLGLSENRRLMQLLLLDESLSSPSRWKNTMPNSPSFPVSQGDDSGELNRLSGLKPTNIEDIFGSQLQSPTGIQVHQNVNRQLRGYSSGLSASNVIGSPSFQVDQSGSEATLALNPRNLAFSKQSQSFIERSAMSCNSEFPSPATSAAVEPSIFSGWGSPDGKLDWAIRGEELNKMRKSASFGFRGAGSPLTMAATTVPPNVDEPDVSWVHSLVKDAPPMESGQYSVEEQQQQPQCYRKNGTDVVLAWLEQLYMEQEQMVA